MSSLFWPAFSTDLTDFKLPTEIQEHMDAYARRYHQIKAPRKMEWKASLGTVVMDVTHNDRTFEVSVNPLQAAILHYFQREKVWRANDLANALGVSVDALRKRIVHLDEQRRAQSSERKGMSYHTRSRNLRMNVDAMDGVHDDDEHVSARRDGGGNRRGGNDGVRAIRHGHVDQFPEPTARSHP